MAADPRQRPGPVLRRPGLDRLPRLRARALRPRRDDRLRLRPAPPGRAARAGSHVRAQLREKFAALGAAPRRGPRRSTCRCSTRSATPRSTSEREIEMNAGGLPNTFVPAATSSSSPSRRRVADRRGLSVLVGGMCETDYLRLSRLPRQHPQVAAGRDQPRPRQADDDRDAADVARQGRDLGDDREARRRAADRAGRSSTPTRATSATASTATPGATAAACARHATCARKGYDSLARELRPRGAGSPRPAEAAR